MIVCSLVLQIQYAWRWTAVFAFLFKNDRDENFNFCSFWNTNGDPKFSVPGFVDIMVSLIYPT